MPVPLVPVLKSIGGSRGGGPPPLFLDETEARTKGRKIFLETGAPLYLRVPPLPLYKDLDPPLKRADCFLEQLAAR